MQGEHKNLEKLSGRYKDEGYGGKIKRRRGKDPKIFRENQHTSTSWTYDKIFGIEAIIRGSGTYEGSIEDPLVALRTTIRRIMRVIGELATAQGKVQQATHEVEEKLTTLTT